MPTAARGIHREYVEGFIAAELERTAPSSAATRYRSLQQLFSWPDDEGEIDRSPMAKRRPPKIPKKSAPVLPDEDAGATRAAPYFSAEVFGPRSKDPLFAKYVKTL